MKKLALTAALGLSLAAPSPTIAGSVVYRTGFEAPNFTAGLPVVGQGGWVGSSIQSPNAAIIISKEDLSFGGKQSVQVRGADLVPKTESPSGNSTPLILNCSLACSPRKCIWPKLSCATAGICSKT